MYTGTRFVGFCRISFQTFCGSFVPPCPREAFLHTFSDTCVPSAENVFKKGCPGGVDLVGFPFKTDPGAKQGQRWRPVVPNWCPLAPRAFEMVPKWSQKGSSMVPDDRMMAWVHKYPKSYAKVGRIGVFTQIPTQSPTVVRVQLLHRPSSCGVGGNLGPRRIEAARSAARRF